MKHFHSLRIHLEQRIEDEEQSDSLVKDLQEHIQKAYAEEIQDKDVLRGSYITRILRLRKVNTLHMFLPENQQFKKRDKVPSVR